MNNYKIEILAPVQKLDGIWISDIKRIVSRHFGVHEDALSGRGKMRPLVDARSIAIHLSKLYTGLPSRVIAPYFKRIPAEIWRVQNLTGERICLKERKIYSHWIECVRSVNQLIKNLHGDEYLYFTPRLVQNITQIIEI